MNQEEYLEQCAEIIHNAMEDAIHEGGDFGGEDWEDITNEDRSVLIHAVGALVKWQIAHMLEVLIAFDESG